MDSFDEHCQKYKTEIEFANNAIIVLPDDKLSWSTFVQSLLDLENSFQCASTIMNMDNFHTDEKIRQKCSDVCTELSKFDIDQSMHRDVFAKSKYYYENQFDDEKSVLTYEQKYYIEWRV